MFIYLFEFNHIESVGGPTSAQNNCFQKKINQTIL